MKTIPQTATLVKLEFDGQHSVLTCMNGTRANTHIFIGEYVINGSKIEEATCQQ